jgi:hypothetical protein
MSGEVHEWDFGPDIVLNVAITRCDMGRRAALHPIAMVSIAADRRRMFAR